MRISDWRSDVCSSDLAGPCPPPPDWASFPGWRVSSSLFPSDRLSGDGHAIGRNTDAQERRRERGAAGIDGVERAQRGPAERATARLFPLLGRGGAERTLPTEQTTCRPAPAPCPRDPRTRPRPPCGRSDEHTSERQSQMSISYDVICF